MASEFEIKNVLGILKKLNGVDFANDYINPNNVIEQYVILFFYISQNI